MMMQKTTFLLLGLFSLNVLAINPTQGPLQQDSSLCHYGYNPNCNTSQQSPPKEKIIQYTHINVPSKYGAIAFDASKSVTGASANANSLSEAKKWAIRQCSNSGLNKRCKVIGWVRNGCIAAAGGKLGKIWQLTSAVEKPGYAETIALNKCKALSASNCRIVVPEACSIPDGMYN